MMKTKLLAMAALLCLLIPFTASAEGDYYTEMPEFLRIKQHRIEEEPREKVYLMRTYPESANPQVDAEITAIVDRMAEEDSVYLPKRGVQETVELDVGASVFRTGTKWMSFVVLSQLQEDRTVSRMRFEGRVYDMETGRRLYLSDVFAGDSPAWEILKQETLSQLNAYFPAMKADKKELDALTSREALEKADFALSAACLRLIFRADTLYEGKSSLMYVMIPYSDIREYMTMEAAEQTDNSRFRMVALTYDDGGAGLYTKRLTYALRENASQATFFIVGNRYTSNRFNHIRQHNMGNSVQSHTWEHEYYEKGGDDKVLRYKEKMSTMLEDLIGIAPQVMRAPGGKIAVYQRVKIGYPLIQWSLTSGDATSTTPDPDKIANRVLMNIENGDIVLMHDLRPNVNVYSDKIMEELNRQGILCVTVEEMYMNAGIKLEPNLSYTGLNPNKQGDVTE